MSHFVEGHYSKLVSMSLHCKWLSPWTFLVVYICGFTLIFGIVNPQYLQLFVQSYDNYHDHMCGIHHQSVLQLSSIITINLYTHIVTLNQLHCICGTSCGPWELSGSPGFSNLYSISKTDSAHLKVVLNALAFCTCRSAEHQAQIIVCNRFHFRILNCPCE